MIFCIRDNLSKKINYFLRSDIILKNTIYIYKRLHLFQSINLKTLIFFTIKYNYWSADDTIVMLF